MFWDFVQTFIWVKCAEHYYKDEWEISSCSERNLGSWWWYWAFMHSRFAWSQRTWKVCKKCDWRVWKKTHFINSVYQVSADGVALAWAYIWITSIWKGIWQLITLKSKSKVHPNIVKVKGKDITNLTEIANAFNNFFINIGPNLLKTILDSSKPFKNFLKYSSLNSFLLKATSEDQEHKLILN